MVAEITSVNDQDPVPTNLQTSLASLAWLGSFHYTSNIHKSYRNDDFIKLQKKLYLVFVKSLLRKFIRVRDIYQQVVKRAKRNIQPECRGRARPSPFPPGRPCCRTPSSPSPRVCSSPGMNRESDKIYLKSCWEHGHSDLGCVKNIACSRRVETKRECAQQTHTSMLFD